MSTKTKALEVEINKEIFTVNQQLERMDEGLNTRKTKRPSIYKKKTGRLHNFTE